VHNSRGCEILSILSKEILVISLDGWGGYFKDFAQLFYLVHLPSRGVARSIHHLLTEKPLEIKH
jgi:hypothetical protein